MKFENQYLTYTDYRLLGGTMDIMPFNLLEFEVRKILDKRTQRRLIGIDEIPQEVKLCVNKMINILANYISDSNNNENINKNIASENTDGYSVTYVTTDQVLEKIQSIIKSKNTELEDIMTNYLSTTIINGEFVLYLGVNQC